MDPNVILSALVSAVGILVLLLYRGHDTRLYNLENNSETKANAQTQRSIIARDQEEHIQRNDEQYQAMQNALKDFRIETREQFVSLRTENNEKRLEMRNDLTTYRSETNRQLEKLSDQIGTLDRRSRRRA